MKDLERLAVIETQNIEMGKKITAIFELLNEQIVPKVHRHEEAILELKSFAGRMNTALVGAVLSIVGSVYAIFIKKGGN